MNYFNFNRIFLYKNLNYTYQCNLYEFKIKNFSKFSDNVPLYNNINLKYQ